MNEYEQALPTFNDLINGDSIINEPKPEAEKQQEPEAEKQQEPEMKTKLKDTNNSIENTSNKETKPQVTKTLTEDEKERIVFEEISAFLSQLNTLKEQGNKSFKENNFQQAEEIYSECITKIQNYTPSQTISREVPQIFLLLQEVQKIMIILCGNQSMALSKQLKYKQAIEKAINVIELDPLNEKSYSRLLQWYIANGEIEKANFIAKDIQTKFSYNLNNFKENLDILDEINKKFKMEELVNKKSNKNMSQKTKWLPWITGCVALIASGLLCTLLIRKHKRLI